MKAAIYEQETGQIIKVVTGPDAFCAAQCKSGQGWLDVGEASGTDHYVVDGALVALPARPTQGHIFDYSIKQWIDPRTAETQWVVVRAERNKLLVASDWTQMPDAPESNKAAWATYRQALRDITVQADPFNIVWPIAPG